MPTPIYYPTTTNAVQKTLDAELLTGVTASATLNNVTGLQNKKGVMVIDRVDANNNLTPAKREYISFDGTSGSTVTTLVRGLAGSTDQDHAVGAIVEFVNDITQQQAIIDGLLLTVTPAGVLNRATGANINTGTDDDKVVTCKAIADSSIPTASSTTTFTNKTHTLPKINEDVALTATSTQLNAQVLSTADGWTTISGTFTYASSTTINVASGAAAIYSKGDKLRFQNNDSGTYLYAYVITVADTLLTVRGDTVPNATLTDAYYSHQNNPLGFPTYFTWTPSGITSEGGAFTNAPTINTAVYWIIGKTFYFRLVYTYNATSGGTGYTTIAGLPVNSVSLNTFTCAELSAGKAGAVTMAASAATMNIRLYDASTIIANSRPVVIEGFYEF